MPSRYPLPPPIPPSPAVCLHPSLLLRHRCSYWNCVLSVCSVCLHLQRRWVAPSTSPEDMCHQFLPGNALVYSGFCCVCDQPQPSLCPNITLCNLSCIGRSRMPRYIFGLLTVQQAQDSQHHTKWLVMRCRQMQCTDPLPPPPSPLATRVSKCVPSFLPLHNLLRCSVIAVHCVHDIESVQPLLCEWQTQPCCCSMQYLTWICEVCVPSPSTTSVYACAHT